MASSVGATAAGWSRCRRGCSPGVERPRGAVAGRRASGRRRRGGVGAGGVVLQCWSDCGGVGSVPVVLLSSVGATTTPATIVALKLDDHCLSAVRPTTTGGPVAGAVEQAVV